jgi:4-alpha-glucanotransferase
MAVLQFAFEPRDPANTHDPRNQQRNQVVYTGTHDNDTVCGWWATLPEERRRLARDAWREAGITADGDAEPSWAMIELALAARCQVAMMQAQDVLSLGSESRMNAPGVEGGWRWQLESGALTPELAERLRDLTAGAERC